MAEFRFYCLNDQDHIVLGGNLNVRDLELAILDAYGVCRDHPHSSTSRIEVWQGASRLYTSRLLREEAAELDAKADALDGKGRQRLS